MPTATPSNNAAATNLLNIQMQLRNTVKDAMDLAKAKMAIFNHQHTLPLFRDQVYIQLAKTSCGYKIPDSSKFSPLVLGLRPILHQTKDKQLGI